MRRKRTKRERRKSSGAEEATEEEEQEVGEAGVASAPKIRDEFIPYLFRRWRLGNKSCLAGILIDA